ncbi:SLC13 family permease [Reyranella sp.]|uniref:SLC13 family permease n=1 Tax=Reyranella sp. TaxID=1929291 RepID=UPI003BABEE9F
MTFDQVGLFALFALVLAALLWGRFRHDLVAAAGLMLGVVLGFVPADDAFSGFSNPAVVIVALVLVASVAFENSGVLALATRGLVDDKRGVGAHIVIVSGVGALLSSVVNNVAALALLMPLDIRAARAAGRPPSLTLMPLAFAAILGGMVTLIGTPPNILASAVRQERLGEPYRMFDFTPVGLSIALAGIAFVAFIGRHLLAARADPAGALDRETSFKAELLVPAESPAIGRLVAELDDDAEAADVLVFGVRRAGHTHHGRARSMVLQAEDLLLVEGSTEAIAEFIRILGLHEADEDEAGESQADGESAGGEPKEEQEARKPALTIVEAVVRTDSRLAGRTAVEFDLRGRYGVTLLGISRAGEFVEGETRHRAIEAGDLLLLAGSGAGSTTTLGTLGVIPVAEASVAPVSPARIGIALGLFAAAVATASAGLLPFTVAIALAVIGYGATGLVRAREFYDRIEWPVVVMLACLLPLGTAFDRQGGTALVADAILSVTEGQSAVLSLVVLMVIVMTLSDILNNVATMVIAGPLAIELAQRLGVNPDTFLMGAAVAASCAFLTPIGHQNNTLIMGPGGYRFSDYWRMGLPLEIVVLLVGVPALLVFWPL